MEPRGGRIEGAVARLLEGQKSAPETPPNKLFGEVKKDTHPQDDLPQVKTFIPSAELLHELEALTAEAGPTLDILQEQAEGSKINGAVLENGAVSQPRMEAIKWLSSQFASFGFRDEWLADAILYMDRMAVQMHRSENFVPLGLERNSSAAEIQAAAEAMQSQDLWLASVMIALKMSEAESELDTSIQDLVVPLVPFDPAGLKCNRQRWQKIKLTEFFVVRELDSRPMVPTALHFVQHLSRKLQQTAAEAKAEWPGLEIITLPKLVGPPLSSKEEEESKEKDPSHERRLTKMQALAQYLADMAVAHRPSQVYGDNLSPAVLAVAVLRLCLYAWGPPPEGCEACLDELQAELGIDSTADEGPRRLLAEVYRLWQRVPAGFVSPVIDRWRRRDCKLPPAPSQEALSPLLQEWCCFLTPLKKKQEPKDLSATPGSRPAPEELDSTKPQTTVTNAGAGEIQPEVRELFPDAPAGSQEERPDPMVDSEESTQDKNSDVPDLVEPAAMEEDTDLSTAESMDVDEESAMPEIQDIGDTIVVPEVSAASEAKPAPETVESKEVDLQEFSTVHVPIQVGSIAPAAPARASRLVFPKRPGKHPHQTGAAAPNVVPSVAAKQDKAKPPSWTASLQGLHGLIMEELNQNASPSAAPPSAAPPPVAAPTPSQPDQCPQGLGVPKLDGARVQDANRAAAVAYQELHQRFGEQKSNAAITPQSKGELPGLQSVAEKLSGAPNLPEAEAKPKAKAGAYARSLSTDGTFSGTLLEASASPTTGRKVAKRKGGFGQALNPTWKKYKGTMAVGTVGTAASAFNIPRMSMPARDHTQAFSVPKVQPQPPQPQQPLQPQPQALLQAANTPAVYENRWCFRDTGGGHVCPNSNAKAETEPARYNWSPERLELSRVTRSKAHEQQDRFKKALQGNKKEEIQKHWGQLAPGLKGQEEDEKAEARIAQLEEEERKQKEALAKEHEELERQLQKGNGCLAKSMVIAHAAKCGNERLLRSMSEKAQTVN